jgi:hypothetical protein
VNEPEIPESSMCHSLCEKASIPNFQFCGSNTPLWLAEFVCGACNLTHIDVCLHDCSHCLLLRCLEGVGEGLRAYNKSYNVGGHY